MEDRIVEGCTVEELTAEDRTVKDRTWKIAPWKIVSCNRSVEERPLGPRTGSESTGLQPPWSLFDQQTVFSGQHGSRAAGTTAVGIARLQSLQKNSSSSRFLKGNDFSRAVLPQNNVRL